MKLLRFILLAMGLIVGCLAAAAVVALIPAVQTWAARLVLASRPALKGSLGSVAATPGGLVVSGLEFEWKGIVCTLPSLRADIPLAAACLRHQVTVNRLLAKGWTLDLSRPPALGGPAPGVPSSLAPATGTAAFRHGRGGGLLPAALAAEEAPDAAAMHVFQGVFAQLSLPVDLAVDGLELEGDVLLPGLPGQPPARVHVTLRGGNLGAGRSGVFAVGASSQIGAPATQVTGLEVHGTLSASMDTPRSFTRLEIQADLAATGGQLAHPVQLTAHAVAARGSEGESYAVSLGRGVEPIASISAQFPDSTRRLSGTWKLNMSNSDLAPFALGRPIPLVSASGEGSFGADASLRSLQARGKLDARADKAGLVMPALEPLGALHLTADFDLAVQGEDFRVEHLLASVSRSDPLISVRALQAFEFNASTGELKVANPSADLMGISVQGLPMAFLSRYAGGATLSGGDFHGDFVVRAGGGGLELRPALPLVASGATVSMGGRPVLQGLDISIFLLADYAPQGWQARLEPLTVTAGGLRLLSLNARLGQLAGRGKPIQATGTWSCPLAAAGAQPFASGLAPLSGGEAAGDFSVSVDGELKVDAKVGITGLVLRGPGEGNFQPAPLPDLAVTLRADRDRDGKIAFSAPITLTHDHKASDLTASGTWTSLAGAPGAVGGGTVDLKLVGNRVSGDDLGLLGALISSASPVSSPKPSSPGPSSAATASPWSGVSGSVVLSVREITLAKLDVKDLSGTVRIAPGELRLDGARASLGDGCQAKVEGGLGFDGASEQPFLLQTNVTVSNFDSAPLFRSLRPNELPTVEGRFDLTGAITARAAQLEDLAGRIQGEFHLTSKGGLFRALRADIADSIKQAPSRLSGAIDTVTSLFGKHPDPGDTSKFIDKAGQAAVEFTERLREIHYDQIHVSAIRGSDLTIHLVDFSMIAPEQRLTGTGEITYQEAQSILEQPLSLDLQLSARGRTADLMSTIGLLKDEHDDLGYSKMIQPVHLGGVLARVDDSQWQDLLVQAALKKAGGSLFNRLLGK